jgi:hypothetical protein
MNKQSIYEFFQLLDKDNQCFIYSGSFSDEITEKIINLSETSIQNNSELGKFSNKVSFLMAECFQNIVRHGGGKEKQVIYDDESAGIFLTRNINNIFHICSANLIHNHEVPNLLKKLEKVNKLDKAELKVLYRDVLKNEELSAKGGAGLGLIEMARKSESKLDFEFEKVNDEVSYFYLQIKIKGKNIQISETDPSLAPISEAIEIRHKLFRKKILMIHKGDFSQDALIPILKMIENNMRHHFEKYNIKKRTYHLLVEVLQNIAKHSYKKDGIREAIFMVGKQKDRYSINAGNFISNDRVDGLKKQLDYLNELDKKALENIYIETLKNGHISEAGGAGLGLIDIARESSDKLLYEFVPVNESRSFYSLRVII